MCKLTDKTDAIIQVAHLTRTFRTYQKAPGFIASVRGLWQRKYETKTAVDDINFTVSAGEVVGFLGPNGAGKTTTLKMLSGLLYPTRGQAQVLGFQPHLRQYEFLQQIGFITGQKQQLAWDLTPSDSFLVNKSIYSIPDKVFQARKDELVGLLQLENVINRPVRQLSLGERMKSEIVNSLLHNPRVVFLDEPTLGLDSSSQKALREFLINVNKKHETTILLTSHYMGDIEQISSRIILINKGNISFNDKTESIYKHYSTEQAIKMKSRNEIRSDLLKSLLPNTNFSLDKDGFGLSLHVSREKAPEIISKIISSHEIIDIKITEESLENIIQRILNA